MKNFLRKCGHFLVYGACGALTVFILANSFVIAFGRPLPFVNAVKEVNLALLQPDVNTLYKENMQADPRFEGNYGAPSQIKIGNSPVRIPLAVPFSHNNDWLARASRAHFMIISPSKNGDIGDTIVYMNAGKTTVQEGYKIEPGANIALDTKRDWRYFYRINETINLKDSQFVLPSRDISQLFLVIQEKDGSVTVITAALTNVQSADQ